jgi:hypothetical protein
LAAGGGTKETKGSGYPLVLYLSWYREGGVGSGPKLQEKLPESGGEVELEEYHDLLVTQMHLLISFIRSFSG